MNSKFIPLLLCCITLFIGCSRHPAGVMDALRFAGDNRDELERVLEHYADEPMKLEAARFLIENMPGHYSYADTRGINRYYRSMDSLLTVMPKDDMQKRVDAIDSLGYAYSWVNRATIQDIHIVTADFLIANIDSAFSKWEHSPWGKHITFEQFCETLLPYKAEELQPLDNWREYMPDSLPLDTRFLYCDQFKESSLQAALGIHDIMKKKLNPTALAFPLPMPIYDLSVRMKIPYGVCEDYNAIATSAMRAHGIPVYNDFTPQWGNRNRLGHGWNILPHNNGQQIPFVGGMTPPGEAHKLDERIAKAFRHTYAHNKEIVRLIETEQFVPEMFKNRFLQDVTAQYAACSDVEVDVSGSGARYAYLAIFSDASTWFPMDFARISNGKAAFHDMGRRCVYLPMAYDRSGELHPVGEPFAIEINGNIRPLTADMTSRHDLILRRKYPALQYVYEVAVNILGGEFQFADNEDFHDNRTIHTVFDGSPFAHETYLSDTIGAHRYWRYIQWSPETFCNIAEIAFYEPGKDTPTYGEILGTDGYRWFNEDMTKDKVFDGDILTAFDAPWGLGAWVGMDFGKPIEIERIRFTGRGDGNSIDMGDTYELFFWHNNTWTSLGTQTATGIDLTFRNVPEGGLYLLRDLTKGKDERIFTYENNTQVWW